MWNIPSFLLDVSSHCKSYIYPDLRPLDGDLMQAILKVLSHDVEIKVVLNRVVTRPWIYHALLPLNIVSAHASTNSTKEPLFRTAQPSISCCEPHKCLKFVAKVRLIFVTGRAEPGAVMLTGQQVTISGG